MTFLYKNTLVQFGRTISDDFRYIDREPINLPNGLGQSVYHIIYAHMLVCPYAQDDWAM